MSNSAVGTVYARIVDEVIDNCRASFEEEGAQPNVLDDFKKEWQKKITGRRVAQMPWDPTPAPAAQNAPAAAPAARPQPYSATAAAAAAAAAAQQAAEPRIKTESGASYDLQNLSASQPATYASSNASQAYANASQQLQERFGDQATASIHKLNERAQEATNGSHGQKRPLPAASPKQEAPDSKRLMTDYTSGMQAQAQAKLTQLNAGQQRQPTVGAAQTDGAADWKAMIAERMSLSARDIQSADRSIMDLVRAQWQAEEGNGLMAPFPSAAGKSSKGKAAERAAPRGLEASQYDGPDDDEDDEDDDDVDNKDDIDTDADVDAINSDLDDDEEEQVDDDDDDDPQQLIVCTYEKVARVKNKWKCVLKDGILITGGQEYVFTKATGEFEW